MDEWRMVDGKKLRCGWTTGSCAAAAAKAASEFLLGVRPDGRAVKIMTPFGTELQLQIEEVRIEPATTCCAVRKFAGDDPDITDGILVYAQAEFYDKAGVWIDGGEGIGRVTKPGLDAAVGEAAINSAPRRMIEREIYLVCEKARFNIAQKGIKIIISIPGGEELARRTFNSKLGIVGGLSILGTTGIVEPVSEAGMTGALRSELSVRYATGERIVVITPGNYGLDFLASDTAAAHVPEPVKCGNFIGETIDMAAAIGFEHCILTGHIGKLIKLAAGGFNTHSRYGDPRMMIFTAFAAASPQGCPPNLAQKLLECGVSDQAIALLEEAGLWPGVKERILEAIRVQLDRRSELLDRKIRCEARLYRGRPGCFVAI